MTVQSSGRGWHQESRSRTGQYAVPGSSIVTREVKGGRHAMARMGDGDGWSGSSLDLHSGWSGSARLRGTGRLASVSRLHEQQPSGRLHDDSCQSQYRQVCGSYNGRPLQDGQYHASRSRERRGPREGAILHKWSHAKIQGRRECHRSQGHSPRTLLDVVHSASLTRSLHR